ncbi:hypothetical protein KC19_VG341100, partial [Ceratodon purpureus]
DGREARRGTNYGSVDSYGRQECGRAPASYCGKATLRNLKSVLSEMRYRCTIAGGVKYLELDDTQQVPVTLHAPYAAGGCQAQMSLT